MEQKIDSRLTQVALVLVAKDVSPGILNPDYLEIKGIVPKEWGWVLGDATTSTPIASVVNYNNLVGLLISRDRFQVSYLGDELDPIYDKLVHIAKKFIEVNPDLHYTMLGTNFHGVIGKIDPQRFFAESLVKKAKIESLGFDIVRTLEVVSVSPEKKISISLRHGEELKEEIPVEEIMIWHGNFERTTNNYPAHGQATEAVSHFMDDWREFQTLLEGLFA